MAGKEKSPLPLTVEGQGTNNLLKVVKNYARPILLAGLADIILVVALIYNRGSGQA